jgi:hypothetical protein
MVTVSAGAMRFSYRVGAVVVREGHVGQISPLLLLETHKSVPRSWRRKQSPAFKYLRAHRQYQMLGRPRALPCSASSTAAFASAIQPSAHLQSNARDFHEAALSGAGAPQCLTLPALSSLRPPRDSHRTARRGPSCMQTCVLPSNRPWRRSGRSSAPLVFWAS